MTIKVWTGFSKRKNSTKQPTGGTQIDVRLKDNCSIENPIFLLSTPATDYTYVEAFGHYYFVNDIVNINAGMSEVHCTQDVLATYKTDIGNTTAFVIYDTTSNTQIPDTRLAMKTVPTVMTKSVSLSSHVSKTGTFIATVTGQDKTQAYIISAANIANLIPNLQTQIENVFPTPTGVLDADFVPTIIAAVRQIITAGNVAENIRDVRWIPAIVGGGGGTTVYAGMYNTGITARPVDIDPSYRLLTDTKVVSIPWQFSDWRNNEPYTSLSMYIPFVGTISIPASQVRTYDSLTINTALDGISGDIAIQVKAGGVLTIGTYGASLGVEIPIGNAAPVLSNLVTSIAAVPTMAAGGLPSIASGIANAATNMFTPLTQSAGGLGSSAGAGLGLDVIVSSVCHDTTVSPSSVSSAIGTPSYASKQIGTLSGYIQCMNASVDSTAKASDKDEINAYLNSGFFYE